MNVRQYVENYRFEFEGGQQYTPNDRDRAMLEDAINGFVAEMQQHADGCPSGDFGPCDCAK